VGSVAITCRQVTSRCTPQDRAGVCEDKAGARSNERLAELYFHHCPSMITNPTEFIRVRDDLNGCRF